MLLWKKIAILLLSDIFGGNSVITVPNFPRCLPAQALAVIKGPIQHPDDQITHRVG